MSHVLPPVSPPNRSDPDTPTAADLVRRARQPAPGALGTLYRQHAGMLTAAAARVLGCHDEAEDVVQDLFVSLPEALERYPEQGHLDAWLRRVVVRLALGRIRARRRRREVALDVAAPDPWAVTGDAVADRLALERAVAALPEPLRLVFVLREVEGYAHADVAALLGISRAASEVRLFRAVRKLRGLLGV